MYFFLNSFPHLFIPAISLTWLNLMVKGIYRES